MATCDVTELLNDGKCFQRADDRQLLIIQAQLLCEILNGGGGGQTCILCGTGAPTEAPPCDCSLYYSDDTNPGLWVWDSVNTVWDEVIAPGP